jgi:hypothetical protein
MFTLLALAIAVPMQSAWYSLNYIRAVKEAAIPAETSNPIALILGAVKKQLWPAGVAHPPFFQKGGVTMQIIFWFLTQVFATGLAVKAATNEGEREQHDGLLAS